MLPAVESVTFAEPPAGMIGVAKRPLSALASCAATSLFLKVTTVPTATVTGLGEYAVVVRLKAPFTIVTVVAAGEGVGVGVGVGAGVGEGAGVELLQAERQRPATRITANRIDMPVAAAITLPDRFARFSGVFEAADRGGPFENPNRFQYA